MKKFKTKLLTFEFICDPARTDEAESILKDLGMLQIGISTTPTSAAVPNEQGKYVSQKGFEISGICEAEEFEKIVEEMSKKKIAGFSRETMILSRPYATDRN